MAGQPQNLEYGSPDSTINLDVYFREFAGGNLIDPDVDPTWEIFDPDGISQATGTGTKISLGYYNTIWSIPPTAVISNLWKIRWNATIKGVDIQSEEYFRVIQAGEIEFGSNIIIDTDNLNLIKKVLGYPSTDNLLLSDLEIKAFCVYPALREYFVRFPLKTFDEMEITGSTEISFPDSNTFGLLDVRVVGRGIESGSGNSFWDIVKYQNISGISGNGRGAYGIPGYNPNGIIQQRLEKLQLDQTIRKQYSTTKYRVDEVEEKLYVYSTSSGKLNVTWAKWSTSFSDVKWSKQMDVIKLSQAYLLEHMADTTAILEDGTVEVSINSGDLKARADELREKVYEKWNEYPEIMLLHN